MVALVWAPLRSVRPRENDDDFRLLYGDPLGLTPNPVLWRRVWHTRATRCLWYSAIFS